MKRQAAYWVGLHSKVFRPREVSVILGVEIITPDDVPKSDSPPKPRACLHVIYPDGVEDWVNIEEIYGENSTGVITK